MNKRSVLAAAAAIVAVVVGFSVTSASAAPEPSPPAVPHGVSAVPLAAPSFQPVHEDVFVPITPCRIVDTRKAVGAFGNGTTRNYYVSGTVGFAPQGGKSGGCGIPKGATAIAATLISVSPSHNGYLRAWPNGLAEPTATVLYYGTASSSSGATMSISTTATQPLRIKNYRGPTHLVIDVSGYYVKQLAVMVSPSGTLYSGSSRALAASKVSTGVFTVQFDRNIEFCAATVTVYTSGYYASASTYVGSPYDTVQVRVFTPAGAAVDQYFYLNVSC